MVDFHKTGGGESTHTVPANITKKLRGAQAVGRGRAYTPLGSIAILCGKVIYCTTLISKFQLGWTDY